MADQETLTPDGLLKEYVVEKGHGVTKGFMPFTMKCAATGGAETTIRWSFTSRYLRNKAYHCNDATLPGGCSMHECQNANAEDVARK